ncbi:MAG: hypothetical protein HY201_05210 [Nitrospirae bacterium]|nr:hypothetical protein [Candidatus Troglogloeales bacterium]MBI3598826.1 hypothetical protein [Candidatus Troglogloeales bacterium]
MIYGVVDYEIDHCGTDVVAYDMRLPPVVHYPLSIVNFFLVLFNIGCAPLLFASPPSFVFSSSEIDESSGIIKSRHYPNIFWTHNDSGDTARIFAVHEDGKLVAEVEVAGAENLDWEDIAAGDQGQIYICDIGGNTRVRNDFAIYLIPEPNPDSDKSVKVIKKIKFRYEGGSHFDAEACFFASGHIYILTKRLTMTKLYRLDPSKEDQVAEKISEYPVSGMVTGADVTPDGKTLAVLTYLGIHIFEKPKENDNYLAGVHKTIDLFFGQAEGIAFDDSVLLITNEEGQLLKVPYK